MISSVGQIALQNVFFVCMTEVHTPLIMTFFALVSDPARVLLSFDRMEVNVFGQVVIPLSIKGQVRLIGSWDQLFIFQQVDFHLRWRWELANMTYQDIVLAPKSKMTGVDIHLKT